MPLYFLGISKRINKKFFVRKIDSNTTIHFGDNRYEDYTMHKDESRKKAYLLRHYKNELWANPSTAGFWSRWLLWNKKSIKSSIKDIENRFNIKVRILN